MIIGCISLVPVLHYDFDCIFPTKIKYVGIKCSKNRGIILPGGKFEIFDKTYKTCAARELKEETGLEAIYQQLLFHGLNVNKLTHEVTYCFAFLTRVKEYLPKDSNEGIVGLYDWSDFANNCYTPYMDLLKDVYYENHRFWTP